MNVDPRRHSRRSIRLKAYDYTQAGAYFITVVTRDREELFGDIVNDEVCLTEHGEVARDCWNHMPAHFPNVQLDSFIIMPNHVHGILCLTDLSDMTLLVGARHAVPLPGAPERTEQFSRPVPGSIPTIIRSFKSATTKRINEARGTPGTSVWQRNYYEHIIPDEASLVRIRKYIVDNPVHWAIDRENTQAGTRNQ